ncbi:hypothetical protein F5Y11DRAFT_345266 [Daldinia sp. FL1419]|nr:hypothetical protein F5Y11DRAFT_345266 [Daldinia sp. FL1419]
MALPPPALFGGVPHPFGPMLSLNPASLCNRTVVCVVCGGICMPTVQCALHDGSRPQDWMHPYLVKGKPGFLEWCRDPWTSVARRNPEQDVIQLHRVVRFLGGGGSFVLENGVRAGINTLDMEMYIPIHLPCYTMTEQFCKYQSKFGMDFRKVYPKGEDNGIPSCIGHFYEIWMKRALMTAPGTLGILRQPIKEPNGYHKIVLKDNLVDYSSAVTSEEPMIDVQERNPLGDGRLTELVLSHLIRIREEDRAPNEEYGELQRKMETLLPTEILDLIAEKLEPFTNLSWQQLRCTRMFKPSWWKDALFNRAIVPWLFDLDEKALVTWEEEYRAKHPDETFNINDDFDWEQLCRQLGQLDVLDPRNILHGSKYIENRLRIWSLLDNARLGHVISEHMGLS